MFQCRFASIILLTLALFTADWRARADLVTEWNQLALETIKSENVLPPPAAGLLAIMHVAMYDALNGITRTHTPYFVTGRAPGVASVEAAVAAAAHQVLITLFSSNTTLRAVFDAAFAADLAGIPNARSREAGVTWGVEVANAILRSRSDDGSEMAQVPFPGSPLPGVWTNTPPDYLPYLLPLWGEVTPFSTTSGSQFRPPPPPPLTSAQYTIEFNLTKEKGSITSTNLVEKEIALYWADGAGTVTPPGHWNVIAQDVAAQFGTTLEENARLFALLNIAEADAGIGAWDAKYTYLFWRPITAIRNAELDGNPDTIAEPTWTPLLITPPFPEHPSGHSTFSAAAATVLAAFFGTDDVSFVTRSDDLPGVVRSFDSFSDAALEAGISRIYGGIHFLSGNFAGLTLGQQIGAQVVAEFLLDQPGRSQRGH